MKAIIPNPAGKRTVVWAILLCALLLAAPSALKSAAALDEAFTNPPDAAKPWVWWHWMGCNISKEGITKDLEAMKAAGIGGATIFHLTSSGHGKRWVAPISNTPWPENTFRSPAWWALMEHAAAEADRLGLNLGMHNCPGWSATGGPWITPEKSMQRVVWTTTPVEGGEVTDIVLKQPKATLGWYRDIGVVAVPDSPVAPQEQVMDLGQSFSADGHLRWQAPPGKWTVYRFGHTSTGAHCSPVPEDLKPEELKALECDKLSGEVSAFHFKQVLDPLKDHLGPRLGSGMRHVLFDSYEAGDCSWTPKFREEFQKRRGYDPLPWLPTLNKQVIGSADLTARFNRDFKHTISELFVANNFLQGREMLHAQGLEMHLEPYVGPFDSMAATALPDVSMCEFWLGSKGSLLAGGKGILAPARAAGQRILAAEAFTGRPGDSQWSEAPARFKTDGDAAWAQGINRLVLHHWVHQPFPDSIKPGIGMGWWGTHFGRHQTWFEPGKAWLGYLTRSQALLQQGESVSDALAVGADGNATPGNRADSITEEDFVSQASFRDGRIVLRSGRSYPALILSGPVVMPATARKVRELVESGATLIGPRMERSPSLQDFPNADAEVAAIGTALWGDGKEPGRTVGKGRVFLNGAEAMAALGLGPDFTAAPKTESVHWCHRRDEGADIYFLTNLSAEPKTFTASFRINRKLPELWDSERGSRRPARSWRIVNNRTEVDLRLEANTSVFVVFRRDEAGAPPAAPATLSEAPLPLDAPWEVSFGKGLTVKMPALASWTTLENPEMKYFSGTARYTTRVTLPSGSLGGGRFSEIDLGAVKELARVFVNGIDCGVAWHAPFRLDITKALKEGSNTIDVDVTNTWANRLIGDEQEPQDCDFRPFVQQKIFKDPGGKFFVGRLLNAFPEWMIQGKPRPSGRQAFCTWNYFTKDSPLMPAGLLGPVRILTSNTPAFSMEPVPHP